MANKNSTKVYDVIIVGSGAGGGMATKVLSEAGLQVAVVEHRGHGDVHVQRRRLEVEEGRVESGQSLHAGTIEACRGSFCS